MISIYPKFYDAFKCKGADCKNTCCQKWEIDIEADSVARYESMPGPLGDDVRAAMTVTDGVHHFKFNKDGKYEDTYYNKELELYDYVNWFNNHRIHGTLGYLTPVQFRNQALKKVF